MQYNSMSAKPGHAAINYKQEAVKVFSDAEDLFDNFHTAPVPIPVPQESKVPH